MATVHDFSATAIDGSDVRLADYAGQVLLLVNTASKCGFTPQYAALESLQRRLGPRGFSVLGFPCNQFGNQEPGSNAEIASFCTTKFDVSFPMFARIEVNGANAHPLYAHLKSARRGLFGTGAVKWNFTKFLVDKAGNVANRYGPAVGPERIIPDIEKLL
jgi:glutathione peroxidase